MSAHSAGFTTRKFFLSVGHCFDRLILVATYNDLILCCPDVVLQRDYYICNPYTKHWVALPPSPGVHRTIVKMGFIFNHAYYNYKELDGGTELNAEYRYRVVLIPQRRPTSSQFLLEIFSSETGEWTQSVIPCPQDFLNFYDLTTEMLAYNGMLYWCAPGGILMELDPFNNHTTNTTSSSGYIFQDAFCRFIAFERPAALEEIQHIDCLSVYQGGLRMCHFESEETLCVWEWKQVQEQSNNGGIGKLMKWVLIKKFLLKQMVTESNPVIVECLNTHAWSDASVLALDPKDEDVFYVDLDGDIVACNFRTRTSFNRVRGSPKSADFLFLSKAYPLSRTCWPTPVPKPFPPHDALVERDTDMDAIFFSSKTNNPINGRYPIWEYFVMAALPGGCKSRSLSLSFLPCFDQTRQIEPYVVGTYNDLILCCRTEGRGRDYYISNPYTMKWIALPRTPRVHRASILTGFTCDLPYYNHKDLAGDGTSSNNIKLNAEYRYRVVRIPAVEKNCLEFTVEIYSSETGEWRESVISSSRGFSFTSHSCSPGVAYNGMIYWLGFGGLLIAVDPFNNSSGADTIGDIVVNNELCRFVQFHKPECKVECVECLGVCRGRLRMCHFDLEDLCESGILCVWELKEVEEEEGDQQVEGNAGRLMKWCLIKKT